MSRRCLKCGYPLDAVLSHHAIRVHPCCGNPPAQPMTTAQLRSVIARLTDQLSAEVIGVHTDERNKT